MAKVINILGKKFSKLTVIKFLETRGVSSHAYWLCKCSCGKEKEVRGSHLKNKQVTSCGCEASKRASIRLTKYANSDAHKGSGNPMWKGKKAGLGAVHNWLARHYKKDKCTHCGTSEKKLDWALISGKKYEHKRENFMPLCRSCHLKYDYTPERSALAGYHMNKNKKNYDRIKNMPAVLQK